MIEPLYAHWIVSKHIFRYLHGTITLGLRYSAKDVRLHGYIDADWVGNVIDRKSTSGSCFSLGYAMVHLMSRKHKFVALSTIEEKYIATSMAKCEAVWLRKLYEELFEQV